MASDLLLRMPTASDLWTIFTSCGFVAGLTFTSACCARRGEGAPVHVCRCRTVQCEFRPSALHSSVLFLMQLNDSDVLHFSKQHGHRLLWLERRFPDDSLSLEALIVGEECLRLRLKKHFQRFPFSRRCKNQVIYKLHGSESPGTAAILCTS